MEPGGNGLGEGSWLHLGKKERRGLLRSENSSISGAHFTRGESMAFGDKGTERFWGALREFCKDRNKWKSEGVMFGEIGRASCRERVSSPV